MDRNTVSAFGALVAITTVIASVAVAWFGPDSRLASPAEFRGYFDSVWSLFIAPGILTLIGTIGALGLASTRIYARPEELSAEARRGLEQHKCAERRLLIGVGILVAFIQLLFVLSTAGFVVSFDSGSRIVAFVLGALFAGAGNMIPKIPFASRRWQSDRATYAKVVRFSGWVITVTGMTICLTAVCAPTEYLRSLVAIAMGSGFGLIIIVATRLAVIAARNPA